MFISENLQFFERSETIPGKPQLPWFDDWREVWKGIDGWALRGPLRPRQDSCRTRLLHLQVWSAQEQVQWILQKGRIFTSNKS